MGRFVSIGLLMAAIAGACTPAGASGDGLPVGDLDAGPGGVASRAGDVRYVTLPASGHTIALAVKRNGGQVVRSHLLRGRYTVPVVALDGTADGLSADGSTLALIRPRAGFPRDRTTLAIMDAREMRTREIVRLRGDFSFDAISPDGDRVYLIQYTSRRDPTRYDVRAYDTRTQRLLPDPIVDPREPGEDMRGYPITRTTSPDGRWAYTLYDGAGKHPFVHALDTRELTAACIDLDALAGRRDLAALGLEVHSGGGELRILDRRNQPLAMVDTKTFEVSAPDPSGPSASDGDGGMSAGLWLAGAAVLAAALGAVVLRVRRRSTVAPT